MKKYLIIGAAALLMFSFSGTSAATVLPATSQARDAEADVKYETYKFNCRNFNGLDLSHNVKARLVKSNSYKVEVTLPAELKKYLEVKVEGGELSIGMNDRFNSSRLDRKYRNKSWTCTAEIAMPELRELEMSGATEFECKDTFDLGGKDFSLDLNGASRLKNLNVNGGEFEAEISGASSYKISGNFKKAEIELSGAAGGQLDLNADAMELEVSGANKTRYNGTAGTISLDVSGASKVTIDGNIGKFYVSASVASDVRAINAECENVYVEASGASKCELNAKKSFTINEASGASQIKYKTPKDLDIIVKSISKAATVKRID